jgi:uncharacterized protein YdaU (DUF1376 family)
MKYPWMPLFWGDFLANTMHLSAQEAGAYLFLIAHAWEHGGEIPGERVRLARIAHVRSDQWPRVWNVLEKFFVPYHGIPTPNGPLVQWYIHRRVTDELHRLSKISSKRKAAAEQMLSKCSANAEQTTPLSTSKTNIESYSSDRSEPPSFAPKKKSQPLDSQFLPNFRDKGVEYRSPPAKKSDNDLADPSREDLKSLEARAKR